MKNRAWIAIIVILIVLLIDQFVKIYIKTHFFLGEQIHVFGLPWFILLFTENIGMAFGLSWGQELGKLLLSLFRIVAVILLIVYIIKLIKRRESKGYIACIALIIAGAFGNIIDSAFYGLIFSESTPFSKAVLFPTTGTYGSFLHGKVVDMLYFPLIQTNSFTFFNAIFNIADSSITVGVFLLLIFFRHKLTISSTKK